MNFSQRLPVFLTDSHPCSYLDDRQARTAFVDPSVAITRSLASALNQKGFRRSGRYLYKTSCDSCSACQPLRVRVDNFVANKSQKRNLKKNVDLRVLVKTGPEINQISSDKYYDLYEKYICARHQKGDMFPPDQDQFENFIGQLYEFSRVAEFWIGEQLLMCALYDELDDGLSAIYTFFDPEQSHRGPGVYAVLWQIQQCIELRLPYLYMGFWIEDCRKMAYKSIYRPHEIFHSDRWNQTAGDPGISQRAKSE